MFQSEPQEPFVGRTRSNSVHTDQTSWYRDKNIHTHRENCMGGNNPNDSARNQSKLNSKYVVYSLDRHHISRPFRTEHCARKRPIRTTRPSPVAPQSQVKMIIPPCFTHTGSPAEGGGEGEVREGRKIHRRWIDYTRTAGYWAEALLLLFCCSSVSVSLLFLFCCSSLALLLLCFSSVQVKNAHTLYFER